MTINIGGVNGGSSAAVTREYLAFDDPAIGGVYESGTDQGAKVQAWFDAAGAALGGKGTAFFSGRIDVGAGRQLAIPTNRFFRLLGAGAGDYTGNGGAALVWTQDPGVRAGGINIPSNANAPRFEKFAMIGLSPTIVIGTMPWQGYGMLLPTRSIMSDVTIRGFGSPIRLINDHQEFYSCDFRGNGYGIDHADNPLGGLGDLRFERCYLIDQACASIAIASTNCIANALYTQGHCGAAPFGIYRYQALNPASGASGATQITAVNVQYTPTVGMTVNAPQTSPGVDSTTPIPAGTVVASVAGSAGAWTLGLKNATTGSAVALTGTVTQVELGRRAQALQGATFTRWSFEYCGNAMFYDEVGGNATWEFIIDGNAEFGTAGSAKWPGKPTPMANIYVDSLDGTWRGNSPSPQGDAPLQPYISAKDARIVIERPLQFYDAAFTGPHKSFVKRSGGIGASYYDCHMGRRMPGAGGSPAGGLRVAGEDVVKGDLLEDYQTDQVRKNRGSSQSRLVGVATMDYLAGDVVLYTAQGKRNGTIVRNMGALIPQLALLKPDRVNNGCVVAASDDRDGPIVGRVHDTAIPAAAAGVAGTGPADIHIS